MINDYTIVRKQNKVINRTKSKARERRIKLTQNAIEIVNRIKEINSKYGYEDEGYVFVSYLKKRTSKQAVNKYLYDVCEEAGVVKKSSHKIRRTALSNLFQNGMDPIKLKEIAGHESLKVTFENYCKDMITDDYHNEIMEKAFQKYAVPIHKFEEVNK